MFGQPNPQQRPMKSNSDNCEISVSKTKSGKKIKFKGNCSKSQIEMFAKDNGVNLDIDED